MRYITASCIISDHIVYTNGKAVFEAPATGGQDFLLSVYQHTGVQYPKFYKMDNHSKLGWLACCELLLRQGFRSEDYRPEEVAVVLSNANASLDTDYKYFATVKEIASPAVFVYTLPNIMIGEICIRHQFKGENAFFVFEILQRRIPGAICARSDGELQRPCLYLRLGRCTGRGIQGGALPGRRGRRRDAVVRQPDPVVR